MDFEFMLRIMPRMLEAAVITLQISIMGVVFGLVFGIFLGSLRVMGPKWLQRIIQLLVDYIRGTPQIVHMLIIYFALPRMGLVFSAYWTGVIALTFIAAGYEVEIVRSAIESINRGQIEAALSVGMVKSQILLSILLPQALRRMIPPLTNEITNIIKASAFLSFIAVNELTKVSNAIVYETFVFIEPIVAAALLYIIIITTFAALSGFIEKRMFTEN